MQNYALHRTTNKIIGLYIFDKKVLKFEVLITDEEKIHISVHTSPRYGDNIKNIHKYVIKFFRTKTVDSYQAALLYKQSLFYAVYPAVRGN